MTHYYLQRSNLIKLHALCWFRDCICVMYGNIAQRNIALDRFFVVKPIINFRERIYTHKHLFMHVCLYCNIIEADVHDILQLEEERKHNIIHTTHNAFQGASKRGQLIGQIAVGQALSKYGKVDLVLVFLC